MFGEVAQLCKLCAGCGPLHPKAREASSTAESTPFRREKDDNEMIETSRKERQRKSNPDTRTIDRPFPLLLNFANFVPFVVPLPVFRAPGN